MNHTFRCRSKSTIQQSSRRILLGKTQEYDSHAAPD